MLHTVLVGAALLLNSLGGASYAWATWRGQAVPHPVTWSLWWLASAIILAAQISSGVVWAVVVSLPALVFPTLVLVLSVFGKHKNVWKISKPDLLCGALSIAGLLAWALTKHPTYAVAFSILSDAFASWPTLTKIIRHPHTEDARAYALSTAGWGVSLTVCQTFTFVECGFIAYNVILCFLFVLLIYCQSWSFRTFAKPTSGQ